MRVNVIMSGDVETCEPSTDLAAVSMMMWRRDCGIVPVVDPSRRVLGVVTDRDICMAASTRHRRPEELTAREVMSGKLFTVLPDVDVRVALDAMRTQKVRRLPVVDADGKLRGIVSLNDIVLHAQPVKPRMGTLLSANDVLAALQEICGHTVATGRSRRKVVARELPETAHA